jgi:hypothetical protein
VPASGLLRDTSGVGFQAGDRTHSRVSAELGLTFEYPRPTELKRPDPDCSCAPRSAGLVGARCAECSTSCRRSTGKGSWFIWCEMGVLRGMTRDQFEAQLHRITHVPSHRVADDWVVARYGVQSSQFLSNSGAWGTIANAAWFRDREASHAAVCPPGTTGMAIRMEALPKVAT